MRRLPDIWPYVLALALLVAFAAGVACIVANLDLRDPGFDQSPLTSPD